MPNKTITVGLVWISTAVALAVLTLTAVAFASTTVQVGTLQSSGWTTEDPFADNRAGGSLELNTTFGAPSGYGERALVLGTTEGTSKAQLAKPFPAPVTLTTLDELSYQTFRATTSTATAGQLPAITMTIDYNGISEAGGQAVITYEPQYQTGGAAAVQQGVWQSWDAFNGGVWWSAQDIPGLATATTTRFTLAQLDDAKEMALIEGYAITQGTGNAGLTAAVDAFNFDGTVYDFEGKPLAATTMSECRDGAWVDNYVTKYRNQGRCISTVAPNQ